MSKFCSKCGSELMDEAIVCPKCGCAVANNMHQTNAFVPPQRNLVSELSSKVKIYGIIWICIGVIQLIAGAYTAWWWTLIVGVLNIIVGIIEIQFSSKMLKNPVGIVKKYEPLVSPIIALVYNLIFGGLIGVVGSIYYFVAIRGFVTGNKDYFLSLEANYTNITNI